MAVTALRGPLISCGDDPFLRGASAFMHEPDGLVICCDGRMTAVGPYSEMKDQLPEGVAVDHWPDGLIAPGFVDAHVHYVQAGIIGSGGEALLDWLRDYTFPAEEAFAEPEHAAREAAFFCDELLRNGTTSAAVFCSVHPQSVDALFAAAARRDMRMVAGKVLMDRNAPEPLRDTAQSGYDESKALIERWHGKGRALYAVTPRFALTSTRGQLQAAGTLLQEHPGVLMQTHIAENRDEVARVRALYPERRNYLDVYDKYGLIGSRSVLAHGVHLDVAELHRCHQCGAALAHCPTSNMFLGSGLFRLREVREAGVEVALGTDIGAGTSFSLLATLNAARGVAQLQARPISPVEGFYLATLGGARALGLDDRIGSLRAGGEADLVVLDPAATPALAMRASRARSIEELLAVLMALGDDRAVRATYVAGRLAHRRDRE